MLCIVSCPWRFTVYNSVSKDLKILLAQKKFIYTHISCNFYQQPTMTALHVLANTEELDKFRTVSLRTFFGGDGT